MEICKQQSDVEKRHLPAGKKFKRGRGTLLKQTCAAQESQESAWLFPVF